MPMPNKAVMIGSPIAMTDPNAMSRMMMAAMMPMNSLESAGASANMSPPSSIRNPGTFTLFRRPLMTSASSVYFS